jgi:preprotein translocase subunit YajC
MGGSFLFVLVILFVFMYLLLIRPQRQQQRRHVELIEALKPGDEVITAGGIFGDVTEVHEDRVALEIAEDVEIEVAKRAIASVVPPEDAELGEDALEEPADGDEAEEPVTAPEPEPVGESPTREDGARR